MRWPVAKRSLGVYAILIVFGVGVCGWQVEEHLRLKQTAAQALINRGRDITSTLGVVVRSQRRFGLVVSKDRIESALQDLVRPGVLESIAILGSTGETIASAGRPVELTPEMLRQRGVYWHEHTLTLMNLMDLGSSQSDTGPSTPAAIVVADERMSRAFRPPSFRRSSEPRPPAPDATANPTPEGGGPLTNATARPPFERPPFGRPPWMTSEEYDAVIQKQGVHSLVITLSTDEMARMVQSDLVLRSLVSLLALAAALGAVLAWRNLAKNSELQIRLVRAGEMNTHLKEMNLAAAGLAHETRNPLNLIRGLAQMIAMQAESSPKLREHASSIMEEADRVTVQLNEFIDYSKPRDAHLAPVDFTRVAADVARTLLPDLEEKHIRLRQPESPLLIEADEPLLRQTLFNLLLNAVQAVGPGGQIEIVLSPVGAREAVLEIRDDGPGVPAAQRAAIFKPYVTMRPKGVGLGLAIVQQIVSAHGWEIVCTENQPRGAVFRVSRLKLAPPPA
ncbi:MAG TPA: HAMP domain-containing sensor histidine kinase [Opitutaceae bacterium]|nr:HAMP domain-containing sensor histidine kinase [Opitutaceae bacterium]